MEHDTHGPDRGPYIRFKLDYTNEIADYIAENYPGLEDIPHRAIETALRRAELSHYQIGQKRYTTPKLIDEWLMSRRDAPRPGFNRAAELTKS